MKNVSNHRLEERQSLRSGDKTYHFGTSAFHPFHAPQGQWHQSEAISFCIDLSSCRKTAEKHEGMNRWNGCTLCQDKLKHPWKILSLANNPAKIVLSKTVFSDGSSGWTLLRWRDKQRHRTGTEPTPCIQVYKVQYPQSFDIIVHLEPHSKRCHTHAAIRKSWESYQTCLDQLLQTLQPANDRKAALSRTPRNCAPSIATSFTWSYLDILRIIRQCDITCRYMSQYVTMTQLQQVLGQDLHRVRAMRPMRTWLLSDFPGGFHKSHMPCSCLPCSICS